MKITERANIDLRNAIRASDFETIRFLAKHDADYGFRLSIRNSTLRPLSTLIKSCQGISFYFNELPVLFPNFKATWTDGAMTACAMTGKTEVIRVALETLFDVVDARSARAFICEWGFAPIRASLESGSYEISELLLTALTSRGLRPVPVTGAGYDFLRLIAVSGNPKLLILLEQQPGFSRETFQQLCRAPRLLQSLVKLDQAVFREFAEFISTHHGRVSFFGKQSTYVEVLRDGNVQSLQLLFTNYCHILDKFEARPTTELMALQRMLPMTPSVKSNLEFFCQAEKALQKLAGFINSGLETGLTLHDVQHVVAESEASASPRWQHRC